MRSVVVVAAMPSERELAGALRAAVRRHAEGGSASDTELGYSISKSVFLSDRAF